MIRHSAENLHLEDPGLDQTILLQQRGYKTAFKATCFSARDEIWIGALRCSCSVRAKLVCVNLESKLYLMGLVYTSLIEFLVGAVKTVRSLNSRSNESAARYLQIQAS